MTQVGFITGGASGFGLELSKKLVGLGWTIYAADKDSKAVALTKNFGAVPVTLDVTDAKKTKAAIDKVIAKEGRLDLMVANAGFGNFSTVEERCAAINTSRLAGLMRAKKHPALRKVRKSHALTWAQPSSCYIHSMRLITWTYKANQLLWGSKSPTDYCGGSYAEHTSESLKRKR